jgi:hypothetical protein
MEYENRQAKHYVIFHKDNCNVSNRTSREEENEPEALPSLLVDYSDHVSSEHCAESRGCGKTARSIKARPSTL